MQKKLFLFSLWILLWSIVPVFAQDNSKEVARDRSFSEPQKLEYQNIPLEISENVLFDNGPLVTLPGGGCNSGDASILDETLGLSNYGYGAQQVYGNYIADDFTNTAAWFIDSLKFFAYQTGATTVTINGIYVQIWDGQPNAGGTVIWGDLTTNRLSAARFTNIYRALNTDPTNCQRRIQEVVVNTSGLNLAPGTYWIQWNFSGTSTSGPWQPPITISGQPTTGNALQFLGSSSAWQDLLDGSFPQGVPFIVYGTSGPPCPVGAPSNPDPADGATNVSINLANLTWTNGTGTTAVEVWFGPVGNLQQVYDGSPITSYAIQGPLNYNTNYGWRIVNKNDTCGTSGPIWTFTTEQDPNLWCFIDNFDSTGNWTITNDGGTCVWTIYTPPYPNAYTIPNASGGVFAADADQCGSGSSLLSTATITNPFDFSNFQTVWIEFDQDFNAWNSNDACYVEVSTDNTNWTTVWQQVGVDLRNTHEFIDVSAQGALQATFYVRLRSVQPGWDWWWAIDNFKVCAGNPLPVELTSFVAAVTGNDITLNWSTATETNNQGFEIQRSNGGEYLTVGFVAGHGTTVEPQSYSFIDKNVGAGKYQYRLKQYDYNGKYEYSSVVEVEVSGPKEFSLAQNYPNPFNPSTAIDFNLAVDSKVTLKVFDILGQEVITLVNGNLSAGSHKVNFDASNLNSGVYMYRIDATGIDGKNFTAVKKMILSK